MTLFPFRQEKNQIQSWLAFVRLFPRLSPVNFFDISSSQTNLGFDWSSNGKTNKQKLYQVEKQDNISLYRAVIVSLSVEQTY